MADTLTKKDADNVFAYSCVSEHSEDFKFFPHKNLHFLIFLTDNGFAPPPLAEMSAKNVSFFTAPLVSW